METKSTFDRIQKFKYMLILEGMAAGILAGFAVSLFRLLVSRAEHMRAVLTADGFHPIALLFFGAMYLIILGTMKYQKNCWSSGIPQVKGELAGRIRTSWWRILIAKIAGSTASMACGLSVGREGPSVQIGAMAAKGFSRLTHRLPTEERLIITAGAGAGLASAFNAPLAGVMFSIEEVHRNLSMELMLTSMAACISGDFVASSIFGLQPIFNLATDRHVPLSDYWLLILFGAIMGVFGAGYNLTTKYIQKGYKKIKWYPLRVAIPVILAAVFAYTYPMTLGGGNNIVAAIASQPFTIQALILVLVIKYFFSVISSGSGAPGGSLQPMLVIGAITGALFAQAIGYDDYLGNFIMFGMAAYFAAVIKAPITGVILISEMTGSLAHILSLSLVCLVAYTVSDLLKTQALYDMLLDGLLPRKRFKHGRKVILESFVQVGSMIDGKPISKLYLPKGCLIIAIERDGRELVPNGNTILKADDNLQILCEDTMIHDIEDILFTYVTSSANNNMDID